MSDNLQAKIAELEAKNAQLRAEAESLREALDQDSEALATGEIRLKIAYLSTIQALMRAIEAKDPYTVGHAEAVSRVAVAVARYLRMSEDECERVRIAGTLLDVGKIGIAGDILLKEDELTDEEREELQKHVAIGAQIVEPILYPWDVSTLIFQHHERIDGSGYPEKLSGGDIEVEAKVLGLADAFVAMIAKRAYRDAHSEEEVFAYFRRQAGKSFDAKCAEALSAVWASDKDLRREINTFKESV